MNKETAKEQAAVQTKELTAAERVMIALDYPNAQSANQLLDQISGIPCYLKVGMQLFYAAGPEFVKELKQRGHRVFLDLKLHDIPNTVLGAAESITGLGVDMFNVHAAGGKTMMEAAMQGVRQGWEKLSDTASVEPPTVIAVTQLTSTNQHTLNDEIGIPGSVEEAVVRYAQLAKSAGLAGVVASPLEVSKIKQTCGLSFITVTPGIRPAGTALGDQSRVMTPEQAIQAGTDYIVIGRPITAASEPRKALVELIQSLERISS